MQAVNVIDIYCDYFEKYKNLLLWEDQSMTKLFVAVGIITFIVVTFFPVKILSGIGFAWRLVKGRTWNLRRQKNNREVCKIEL